MKGMKSLAALGLAATMLVSVPVYAAPQTMADGGTFDAAYYAQNNPDIVAAYGSDANVLYAHYENSGKAEGRLGYAGDAEALANLNTRIANGTVLLPEGVSLEVYQRLAARAAAQAASAASSSTTATGTTQNASSTTSGVSVEISAGQGMNSVAATGTSAADAAALAAAQAALEAQAAPSEFEQYIQQLLASITTADMTPDQKLRAAWNWLLGYASYKRTYETPSGDWTQQYAQELLTSGKGNCYRYAAAFAYLAKEIGCDVKVVTGQINAARGGVTPHGWCVITVDGTEYICDPDMADAKNNWNAYYMKTFAQYPVKPLNAQHTWEINF